MKKNIVIVLFVIFCANHCYYGYGQMRKIYSTIETKGVLYYKVEEIINMAFGGTSVWYTVSDLSLISKVDLGPENVRIITPFYKDKSYLKKSYYIETKNANINTEKNREPTQLVAISIESGKIEIPENSPLDQRVLALVIGKIIKVEPVSDLKNEALVETKASPVSVSPVNLKVLPEKKEPQKEKLDYILVNVVYVYERVLEKGYKSAYMSREVANYYYFKGQMEKAAKWYEELFTISNEQLEPIYYYRFGDALKKTGKTTRGNALIEKFNQLME